MALTANAARERAEEWLQQVQKQAKALLDTEAGLVRSATSFIHDKRDEVERRVEDVVGRILASLQIVTTKDVAELNAKLKTIAKRLDQMEHKKKAAKAS
ncbi:MAG: phasin family protein [Myxococcota bacterium]